MRRATVRKDMELDEGVPPGYLELMIKRNPAFLCGHAE